MVGFIVHLAHKQQQTIQAVNLGGSDVDKSCQKVQEVATEVRASLRRFGSAGAKCINIDAYQAVDPRSVLEGRSV